MGKTVVLYATMTRHSRRLAKAIGAAIQAEVFDVSARPELRAVDLLLIVGGIYGGQSLPKLTDFIAQLDGAQVKRAALITSCASGSDRQVKVREILEGKGIELLGEHVCRGGFLLYGIGRPNRTDVEQAVAFATGIARQTV
ncbi:MAG: flavodoxin domain-containing protein [Christensenellales bacterium]|jgi:flavodoxin